MLTLLLIQLGMPDPVPTDPLGIEALAGHVRGAGLVSDVALVDQPAYRSERNSIRHIAPDQQYDVVGLSSMWPNFEHLAASARLARQRYPRALLVVGGSIVEALGPVVLEDIPEIDLAVRGAGEEALARIIEHEDPATIPNVYYRDGTGVRFTRAKQFVPLSVAPPDRSLLAGGTSADYPYVAANIEVSRGCDFGACTFCHLTADAFFHRANSTTRHAYYQRAPMEAAFADYRELVELGVPRIKFVDEEIFGGRGEPLSSQGAVFLRRVRETSVGLETPKSVFARSPDITAESVELLRSAGVTSVFVGIESGSPRQLKQFGKGAEIPHNVRAIRLLRRAGIRLKAGFIMLHPLSTASDVLLNIAFLDEHDLYASVKNPLNAMDVIPNSSFHRLVARLGPQTLREQDRHRPNIGWVPADQTFRRYWRLIQAVNRQYGAWVDSVRVAEVGQADGRLLPDAQAAITAMHRRAAHWLRLIALEAEEGVSRSARIEAGAARLLRDIGGAA